MKKDTSKSSILIISMGFLVFFLIFNIKWLLYISLAVGVLGALSTTISQKIEWAWMKLAGILSLIIPTILLTLVFYLVLFPVSLLYRIFNKDSLMLSSKYDSYFIAINRKIDKKSMENIW